MYQVFKPTILNSHSLWLMESQSKSTAKPQSLRQAPVHCDSISKLPVITSRYMRPAKRRGWKYARLAPRAIRMALHISISDDKFPAGGKTYIENYPAIDEVRSGIELAVR